MKKNKKENHVWVILSNNVPVEAYKDESIAKQVANTWNKTSSTYVTYYRVSLIT